MTEPNVHPTVRIAASQQDADSVEACSDRGDSVQHRIEWHFDPTERVNFDVPTRRFDTKCLDYNPPIVKSRGGKMMVVLYVFADKGSFPRSFEQYDNGLTSYLWDDSSWRQSTA